MSNVIRVMAASLVLALATGVHAADKKDARVSKMDRTFITEAAHGGHAEVELGKLAQKNGENAAVKAFGQRMVEDHGKANKELAAIAGDLGVKAPAEPSAKQKADAKRLAKLQGAQFDREYGQLMVKDHEKTIALFEKEAQGGEAEALKAFASKTLPTLQEHLKMARDLPGAK